MLGLCCEVNAGVLAITGLHELTPIWDVAYADGRREVTPTERHIHGVRSVSRRWPRCS